MKSRVILAAGMLMLASVLARADELPPVTNQQQPAAAPVTDQQQPAAAPAPTSPPAAPLVPAPCGRPVPYDPCQKFQDWLTFCPQHTPCCGHCCGCGCTPACPPLYTYFLDHCGYYGYGYGYGYGHGCGCGAPPPPPAAPLPAPSAPCETCGAGWWHRLLGH
jgi:hypothetical protein